MEAGFLEVCYPTKPSDFGVCTRVSEPWFQLAVIAVLHLSVVSCLNVVYCCTRSVVGCCKY